MIVQTHGVRERMEGFFVCVAYLVKVASAFSQRQVVLPCDVVVLGLLYLRTSGFHGR